MPAFPSKNYRLSELNLSFRVTACGSSETKAPDHADRGLFLFEQPGFVFARRKKGHIDAVVSDDPAAGYFFGSLVKEFLRY